MGEHHSDPGPDPTDPAPKSPHETERAKVKAAEAREAQQAEHDLQGAQRVDKQARAEAAEEAAKEAASAKKEGSKESSSKDAAPKGAAAKAAGKPAQKAPAKKAAKAPAPGKAAGKKATKRAAEEADEEEGLEVVEKTVQPKQKPELQPETVEALEARAAKKAKTPVFRRHEWWRYKDLGGKHASWRRPRGIHSKQRRHFKYRPPVVSIGYRGPRAARGLHPSGFEEVLVHRPEDLQQVDPKTQAARVGGTVGGRKAELIEKEADRLGVRVLNRRNV